MRRLIMWNVITLDGYFEGRESRDGVRLVSRLDEAPVELELLETGHAGQVTHLRFSVRGR